MARTFTKYPLELREKFISLCKQNGGNVEATAKQLKMGFSSAHKIWQRHSSEGGKDVYALQKSQFTDSAWRVIRKILSQLRTRLRSIEPDRLRAYNQLLQTLYEKQSHAMQEPDIRSEKITKKFSAHSKQVFLQFQTKSGADTQASEKLIATIDRSEKVTPRKFDLQDISDADVDDILSDRLPKSKRFTRTK